MPRVVIRDPGGETSRSALCCPSRQVAPNGRVRPGNTRNTLSIIVDVKASPKVLKQIDESLRVPQPYLPPLSVPSFTWPLKAVTRSKQCVGQLTGSEGDKAAGKRDQALVESPHAHTRLQDLCCLS